MSRRNWVKDPRWAKLAQELWQTEAAGDRAWTRLSRAFFRLAKIIRQAKNIERRQRKREAELDAEEQRRKEVVP